MSCEMCGREGKLMRCDIEGAIMSVCSSCSSTGKILKRAEFRPSKKGSSTAFKRQKEEITEVVVEDFPAILKKERESRKMNSKEFASFLAEKESTLHKLEQGSLRPSLDMARRYQKKLKRKLIKVDKDEGYVAIKTSKGEGMTLGDFIKVR